MEARDETGGRSALVADSYGSESRTCKILTKCVLLGRRTTKHDLLRLVSYFTIAGTFCYPEIPASCRIGPQNS